MNRLLSACAILGATIVGLGAFGAHALDAHLSLNAKDWWETATFYGLTHIVTALTITLHGNPLSFTQKLSGWAFIIGVLIFSGSLYAMSFGAPPWFGAITPIGGLCFIAGWVLIIKTGLKPE